MNSFTISETGLQGLLLVQPSIYEDHRGYFMETWHSRKFRELGLPAEFVQDNQSGSRRGVLRGLHFQKRFPQGKLVRVTMGEVYDVAVDIRPNSKSFGQWYGVHLSAENKKMLYVPEGFAHGFYVLSEFAEFLYKCTNYYNPSDEGGLVWNDPDIGIQWPILGANDPIINQKDSMYPTLQELKYIQEGETL